MIEKQERNSAATTNAIKSENAIFLVLYFKTKYNKITTYIEKMYF